MKYLVDTSIWSLALRKDGQGHEPVTDLLVELVDKKQVVLCGPVRQELLSGIKLHEQFRLLKSRLRHFKDLPITTEDYELAAQFFNLCRSKGVQASNIDFLLCSLAANNNLLLLTADQDFLRIEKHIKVRVHFIKV
ncbi:MAG: PIN domain-containing protein [Bacteroidetes bacterium]|nr:PIN domain-containing protein [Bacteroidota bacterium]MBU1681021.1 PIN domain-containing protein [Bacteroidota bacterium]MBU2508202.1 PIN domain-containing protein [Bacteroidota bacterium]